MPSLASKVTLASSICITGGIIVGVHYYQFDERKQVNKRLKNTLWSKTLKARYLWAIRVYNLLSHLQLRKGIKLDIERQEAKRAENWRRLEEQKELTKSFRRIEQQDRSNKSESWPQSQVKMHPLRSVKIKSGKLKNNFG